MRLSRGDSIPIDLYSFIYEHKFYTKVLFTFSILYLVSPIIISLYSRSKYLLPLLISLLFSIYCIFLYAPIPETLINSEMGGVFFGVGDQKVYYPIFPALIIYCIGFLVSCCAQQFSFNTYRAKILSWLPLSILVLHSLSIISSSTYKSIIGSEPINLLATCVFVSLSLILTRRLLLMERINSILTKKEFILIGTKTLTFYLISNMILGFLNFPREIVWTHKIIVFLLLFSLTYLITAWNFYSDYYSKLLRN